MKNLVFTEQSIVQIANDFDADFLVTGELNTSDLFYKINLSTDIEVILTGNKKDSNLDTLPLIVIDKSLFYTINNHNLICETLLEIHSMVLRFNQNKNLRCYIPSKIYCKDNQIVLRVEKFHVFILVNAKNSNSFFVFDATESKSKRIEDSQPNFHFFDQIMASRNQIKEMYQEAKNSKELQFKDNYNFDMVFLTSQQQNYTYQQWLNVLSGTQKAFLNKDISKGIKLKGPAGTGKTLAMELKAIKLIKENPNVKILFTCHSWSVAFQVSDFISGLDFEASNNIDVIPLLTLAQERVAEKTLDAITLGDDSFTGKIEQIKLLNEIILTYQKNDWRIMEAECSDNFKTNFNSITSNNNNYTWDIMIEISCIIGANGIMPNTFDFNKYDKLERRLWMMPLENQTDRKVVFDIYCKLMTRLEEDGKITTDQIFNDYINFLTTYTWFRLRKKEGYDYIFIDEMQLFNAQEKLVLSYLTKKIEEYPILIMAMDPKQAVNEIYNDFGISDVFSNVNPEIEKSIGKSEEVLFDVVYRYTNEILSFLKHIDSCYPAMDFHEEWNNNIKKTISKQQGIKPNLFICNDIEDEIETAMKKAEEFSKNNRVAILSLQDNLFHSLQKKISDKTDYKIVDSIKISHTLKYVKRNIFVSKPSYVIGLQFDIVILLGCYSTYKETDPNQSYYIRRFLSDLYLGASRAKTSLLLMSNKNAPSIPFVLQNAIEKKIIDKIE